MKVKAPDWIFKTPCKEERLFIAFLYSLATKEGFRTAYYFYASDMAVFFPKKPQIFVGNTTIMQHTRKHILFAKLNDDAYTARFDNYKCEEVYYEIKDKKRQAMWLYLETLLDKDLVINRKKVKGLRMTYREPSLNKKILEWLCNR